MLSTIAPVCAGGMILRMAFSTSPKRAAVSSIRMPTGARTCIRIWPPSTCGKKFSTEEGRKQERGDHESEKTEDKNPAALYRQREQSVITLAHLHEARLEAALQAHQRVAGRGLMAVVLDAPWMRLEEIFGHGRHERS